MAKKMKVTIFVEPGRIALDEKPIFDVGPQRTGNTPPVQADDLERMHVQMHRMGHHRHVVERQHVPFAGALADYAVMRYQARACN